jgi:flavin-dependent dehydrogenase
LDKRPNTFDVIVVGAGPGGSIAAKKCAQSGLNTLLLDKRRLPREKVCSGMIMGTWAHEVIDEEFGGIPQDVLADPCLLSGQMIHLPGEEPHIVAWRTELTWRKVLDEWMNQQAKKAGVRLWENARVIGITQSDKECTVFFEKGNEKRQVLTKFVVGADGAASSVRKSICPELKPHYWAPVRECYKGALDLDRNYYHWFFPDSRLRPRFGLHHKEGYYLIEGSGIREKKEAIQEILAGYGFKPELEPEWKDGCMVASLHEPLFSGHFVPAKGNILLIGDAAGLVFPISFEGIGAALKSGSMAADSIAEAMNSGKDAAGRYLLEIQSILGVLRRLFALSTALESSLDKGAKASANEIAKAYEATLTFP